MFKHLITKKDFSKVCDSLALLYKIGRYILEQKVRVRIVNSNKDKQEYFGSNLFLGFNLSSMIS